MSSFCKRTTSLTSMMLAMVTSIISSSVNTPVKQITDNKRLGPIVPSSPTKSSQVSCFSFIQPFFSNHQAKVHSATCKKFNQNNKLRSCFSFPSSHLLSELNPPFLTPGWILPWSSPNQFSWSDISTTSSGQPKYNPKPTYTTNIPQNTTSPWSLIKHFNNFLRSTKIQPKTT